MLQLGRSRALDQSGEVREAPGGFVQVDARGLSSDPRLFALEFGETLIQLFVCQMGEFVLSTEALLSISQAC